MGNKKPVFWLVALILLIAFVAPQQGFAAGKMPTGTKVANLNVEKMTEEEIESRINDEIVIWQAQDEIILEGEFEKFTISRDAFDFDVQATMNELKDKTKRKLSNFFKRPKNVQIPLVVKIDESHPDVLAIKEKSYIDFSQVFENLVDLAGMLESYSITIPYIEGEEVPLETLAEVNWNVPDLSSASLKHLVEELNGAVIPANEFFSFLQSIEVPEKLLNSKEETSFLGSALYTLFLQTNFDIVERHPQLTLPPYGEKGVNAEVNYREEKDLVIMNNDDVAYRIGLELKNDTLNARLEGIETTNHFEIAIDHEEKIEPRTIYRYSKKLKPGEQQVVQSGENGLKVDVYRVMYDDGVYVDEELISKEFYLPTPKIVLVSPDDPEVSEREDDIEIVDDSDQGGGSHIDDREVPADRPGRSISDFLPDEIDDEAEYDAIKEIEELQRQYEAFLDKMLEAYAKSLERMDEQNFMAIAELRERVEQLDRIVAGLISNLIHSGVLGETIIDDLIEEGLINENFIEVFVENGFLDEEFLEMWKDGAGK